MTTLNKIEKNQDGPHTLGERIEWARAAMGFSTAQLARRLAIKTQTLENWENDRSAPRPDKLTKLTGILGVSLMWLLTGRGADEHTPTPDYSETALVSRKLERAVTMQQDLAALLLECAADLRRLQRELDEESQADPALAA